VPAVAVVGGVPVIVGGVFAAVTAMPKAGSDADALPSLTLITMLPYVPTAEGPGVPSSAPVFTLKVAQAGRFAIAKVSGSVLASAAVGWNTYCVPCLAVVGGVPVIVGALFVGVGLVPGGAVTVMLNGASDAVLRPSLTEITMLLYVPVFALCGVPRSWPLVALNVAHAGRLRMVYVRALPSGSVATGVKLYVLPAATAVAGVPEITGARLRQ
jgi:hypothetical protein